MILGWSDELCYGTGATYLSGLAFGGLWGLREGYARPLYKNLASTVNGTLKPQASTLAAAQASAATAAASPSSTSQPITRQRMQSAPFRLRLNTVLNAMTSRGSFVGNNAGVLGTSDLSIAII